MDDGSGSTGPLEQAAKPPQVLSYATPATDQVAPWWRYLLDIVIILLLVTSGFWVLLLLVVAGWTLTRIIAH